MEDVVDLCGGTARAAPRVASLRKHSLIARNATIVPPRDLPLPLPRQRDDPGVPPLSSSRPRFERAAEREIYSKASESF